MSMTIGDANDIILILRYFLEIPLTRSGELPDPKNVKAAAVRLADRAHRRVSAGLTGSEVTQAFARRTADDAADLLVPHIGDLIDIDALRDRFAELMRESATLRRINLTDITDSKRLAGEITDELEQWTEDHL
ncbi:hypothetical protein G1H11_14280 [Phytoactinopolyspora alkaliphila]|uniref:Uncharacterized protein n=1 Tax=Phytoactinopolyspora alkaliphila TaxID=1783498 RepID=A0A6N9YNC1_9ACTN|nr:hypothetical protein [Phytoactinopolyspora alkaliphila]NED96474.1 hypothetical protein [Phytoactinopolyspora alkaliphila]